MQPGKFIVSVVGVALLTILALVIGAIAFFRPSLWQQAIPSQSPLANERVDLTVSAQALFEAYTKDVASADLVYNNKVLELDGTVSTVGKDKKGPYVIFAVTRYHRPGPVSLNQAYARIAAASASGIQGVRCYLKPTNRRQVKEGQEITLRGQCVGMPLDVEIRDCALLP